MELDENGGLVVVVPAHWSKTFVAATMARNVHRVERFLARSRARHTNPLQYVEGEKHLYLGQAHELVIHVATANKNRVAVIDGEIHVWVPAPLPGKIHNALQNWYLCQAKEVFRKRLAIISHRAPWTKDKNITLKLRRMKRTWGNCSSKEVIKLNTHLIKASVATIDSVIAHELCHLQVMNHSPVFYTLLEKLNPGWKQDRARLRSEGFIYLLT